MLTDLQINNLKELISLISNTNNDKEFNKDFIGLFLACMEAKMDNIILSHEQTEMLKEKLKHLEQIKTRKMFIKEYKDFMKFILQKLLEKI